MIVAEAVGRALAGLGIDTVFGVVGSGNFHVTNALVAAGARYVAARHEGGAATMADAYARTSGGVGVLSVHQGPGLTNAMTGIAEAAKSRTPLLILAGEAGEPTSNFHVDQESLVTAVGAISLRVRSAATAVQDTEHAYRVARHDRRTVLLNLPLNIQGQTVEEPDDMRPPPPGSPGSPVPGGEGAVADATTTERTDAEPTAAETVAEPRLTEEAAADATTAERTNAEPTTAETVAEPRPTEETGADATTTERTDAEPTAAAEEAVAALAGLLSEARRPVFVAGRGARQARDALLELADEAGALVATSAVARGLFKGSPWDLDVSGGFASPTAAELIAGADLIVAWGCALNMWTTRHGALIGPDTRVVQVDLDADAIGRHRPVHLGVPGDVRQVATQVTRHLAATAPARPEGERGYRTAELATRIATEVRWRDVPYEDASTPGRIDPRTLSIELDDLLPEDRVVAVDSGNFMGYPSMLLSVPDERGFCFTQAFQSIGLGLATAIGAALAQPHRLPVAALGDGGALMGVAELETVVRLGLPMVIVVYDDEAYGAEVHHFGPGGHPLDTVTFPPVDIAAIARGFGCEGVTIRERADLAAVAAWVRGPRTRPLLLDAKVTADRPAWWLEEAFRGH
ncbi:thiamine pyrophosphate-binding protein [Streptosporangium sp. KLBMP 9127]|nr:thiamine pyrophosphate-binding protein [Streptosporangium sp. KLBMP 9127]